MNTRPVFVNTPTGSVTQGVTRPATQVDAVNAQPCAVNTDALSVFTNRSTVNSRRVFVNTRQVFTNTSTANTPAVFANTPDGRPLSRADAPTDPPLKSALQ